MALGILGTPSVAASGTNYTPESGTDRLVVVMPRNKWSPLRTLTNVEYNSVTRTPAVADAMATSLVAVGICIFKESELPGGASAATTTWDGTPVHHDQVRLTVGEAEQTSTVRTNNNAGGTGTGTSASIPLTGLTVGDLCLAVYSGRYGATVSVGGGWTQIDNITNGEGGTWVSAYKIAASTTETFTLTITGGDDYAAAAVAIAQQGGGEQLDPITACFPIEV